MYELPYADDGDPPAPPLRPDDPEPSLSRRTLWTRVALGLIAAMLLFVTWVVWRLPVDQALQPLPDPTLVLLDRNGKAFARRGAFKDEPVDVAELPQHVVNAVVATEDRRFFKHVGVDPRGIARALMRNARAGGVKQGGSTITQQLAKTAFLEPDRTLRRKLREVVIALYLEARLDKREILSRYLSSIYFGDGVYGLRAAARHYFDKPPEKLALGEAAMLAGMIKAPSTLAPTNDLEASWKRAKVVLGAMVDAGFITEEEADDARKPKIRNGRGSLPVGSWFADWVSSQAKGAFDADYGEVRVRTTIDARMQEHARRVVRRWLAGPGKRLNVSQAALVAMLPNGEVVAMVGGRDYEQSQYDRVTQAKRQPGSAFKLFTFLAALRAGATPETRVDDSPITIGDWKPENYDGRYAGPIPLRDAFARSSNVAAVRLATQVGPGAVAQAARDLGIQSEMGNDVTIALGTSEVNLMELTAAYAALAAGAAPVTPHGLPGRLNDARPMSPLDPTHRAMMLDMLWSVVEQGTGRAARLDMPTFGKTGTTQGYRDALFVGMAGDLVVGVWVGNDDGTPMRGVTGGSMPAQMWREFMTRAVRWAPTGTMLRRPGYANPAMPLSPPDETLIREGGEGPIVIEGPWPEDGVDPDAGGGELVPIEGGGQSIEPPPERPVPAPEPAPERPLPPPAVERPAPPVIEEPEPEPEPEEEE